MVNWDNDTTVGTPAVDIERVTILQRRFELIEAYEDYSKKTTIGVNVSLNILQSRLRSLFIELSAMLERRLQKEKFKTLKEVCFKKDISETEVLTSIYIINKELDIMRLTRIDTQKVYDSTKVEAENKMKGY